MASTIHAQMISDPSLLDIVDDSWREDNLPDDGKLAKVNGGPRIHSREEIVAECHKLGLHCCSEI